MSTEFLTDAAQHLITAMRSAGIAPDVAGPVARNWMEVVVRNWGGERPYIGKAMDAHRVMGRRDAAILRDWRAGERAPALARRYGISARRVRQIVEGQHAQGGNALP